MSLAWWSQRVFGKAVKMLEPRKWICFAGSLAPCQGRWSPCIRFSTMVSYGVTFGMRWLAGAGSSWQLTWYMLPSPWWFWEIWWQAFFSVCKRRSARKKKKIWSNQKLSRKKSLWSRWILSSVSLMQMEMVQSAGQSFRLHWKTRGCTLSCHHWSLTSLMQLAYSQSWTQMGLVLSSIRNSFLVACASGVVQRLLTWWGFRWSRSGCTMLRSIWKPWCRRSWSWLSCQLSPRARAQSLFDWKLVQVRYPSQKCLRLWEELPKSSRTIMMTFALKNTGLSCCQKSGQWLFRN